MNCCRQGIGAFLAQSIESHLLSAERLVTMVACSDVVRIVMKLGELLFFDCCLLVHSLILVNLNFLEEDVVLVVFDCEDQKILTDSYRLCLSWEEVRVIEFLKNIQIAGDLHS